MTVLGIDSSKRATGFAFKVDDKWHFELCRGDDLQKCRLFVEFAYDLGCRVAYIEDAGPVRLNPKIANTLSLIRGQMTAWCHVVGMEYHLIAPRDWHKTMLGKYPRGGSKPASILAASGLGADVTRERKDGTRVLDDNLADAVNLSAYGALQEGMNPETGNLAE